MTERTQREQAQHGQRAITHGDASVHSGDDQTLELVRRRRAHVGASLLFYRSPIHIVRGEGVSLFDADGRRYLDCYNNVASVGHCHPRVVDALCRQARTLNTHTRYLHENVIEYAEALAATLPDPLEVCMFACTGTEANELAMRLARTVTGRSGIVVMDGAYHGNSSLIHELSTMLYAPAERPPHVACVEPPNLHRGTFRDRADAGRRYADGVDAAIAELDARGQGTAAFLCDTIFDSQGCLEAPPDYFERVYAKVRAAGGLCVADEVQAGLARTGRMWGFEHYGVVPDIVTMGKPMGDGHPVAAVVTTREIAETFASRAIYFNTFGGNPVSAAAGKAVLDVVRDEGLVEHAARVGAYLRTRLEELAEAHAIIGNVRGLGLFLGVELVDDRETLAPASARARQIPDRMREAGVLIGLSGRLGNVLKVRPPLVFSRDDADTLVERLDQVLREIG